MKTMEPRPRTCHFSSHLCHVGITFPQCPHHPFPDDYDDGAHEGALSTAGGRNGPHAATSLTNTTVDSCQPSVTPPLWRRRKRIVASWQHHSSHMRYFLFARCARLRTLKAVKQWGYKGKLGLDDAQTKDFARSTIL